jgi:RNA polymerase sigma-70 factor (ECF subfamily)
VIDTYLSYLRRPSRRRYERFVEAYLDAVHRVVSRVVSDPGTADDVTQKTFLKLAHGRIRGENLGSPRSYVLRTAVNLARDHLRRESVRRIYEERAGEMMARRTQPPPGSGLAEKESLERIHRAIDSLPGELRLVVHLRAIEGLSYREIAGVTGTSEATVGTRLHRARRRLRWLLSGLSLAGALRVLLSARERGEMPRAPGGLLDRIGTGVSMAGTIGGLLLEGPVKRRFFTVPLAVTLGAVLVAAVAAVLLRERLGEVREVVDQGQRRNAPADSPGGEWTDPVAGPGHPPRNGKRVEATVPRFRLSGRLVDLREGTPLAGARARILCWEEHGLDPEDVTADGEGRFTSDVPDVGQESLGVLVPGYRAVWRRAPVALTAGGQREWDLGELLLDPGSRISLLIQRPDGEPIPRATVTPRDGAAGSAGELGLWASTGFPHHGDATFRVEAPGHASRSVGVRVAGDTGPVPVVLEPAGEVRGSVIDPRGSGVPGVEIWHDKRGSSSKCYELLWGYFDRPLAVTDDRGRFGVRFPAGRTLRLRAGKWRGEEIEGPPLVEGEVRELDPITLDRERTESFRVVVRDPEGVPVPHCRLLAEGRWRFCDSDGAIDVVPVDASPDARFLWLWLRDPRFLPDGPWSPGEIAERLREVDGAPTLLLTARPGKPLRGRVREPSGGRVAEGYVVLKHGEGIAAQSNLDPDGFFGFRAAPETPFVVTVSSTLVVEDRVIGRIPASGLLDLELAAPRWSRLEVEVDDAGGAPVPEGECWAIVLLGERNFRRCSETQIRAGLAVFRNYGREVSSYTGVPRVMFLCGARGVSAPQPVSGSEHGRPIRLGARLQPFGRLSGTVASEDDIPLAGALVLARWTPEGSTEPSSWPLRESYTGLDGSFSLTDLPPGRYVVWAHAPGTRGAASRPVEVTCGDTTNVELRLPPGRQLRGRVVDLGGRPVEGATITLELDPLDIRAAGPETRARYSPITDVEGRFTFDGLPGNVNGYVTGVTRDGEEFEDRPLSLANHDRTDEVLVRVP